MRLKQEVIKSIRRDKILRAKIVLGMGTTSSTMYRWLQIGDVKLTTATCLDIISRHLGVRNDELLEKEQCDTATV